MVLVTGNWRMWLAGMLVSLAIFGVVYFTVIKPSSDNANQALRQGMQQSQQVLSQAQRQIGGASGQAGGVSSQGQAVLGKAARLTACVSAAGTDPSKLQACQVKFGH